MFPTPRAVLSLLGLLLVLLAAHAAGAATLTISGSVVDSDGKPVPEGKVGYVTDAVHGTQMTTLENGCFLITLHADLKVKLVVLVQANGYAPFTQTVLTEAFWIPLKIMLQPGHHLQGTVLDETGKPVVGAHVCGQFLLSPGSLPADFAPDYDYLHPETTSDKDGRFLLAISSTEGVQLSIDAEGYTAFRNQHCPPDTPQTITLTRQAKICGQIIRQRDGQPVTKFALRIGQTEGNGRPICSTSFGLAESPDGSFMRYIPGGFDQHAGPITLEVDAPGYMVTCVELPSIAPDAKPLLIRMPDAGKLSGRISDRENGKPLAGVVVSTIGQWHSIKAFDIIGTIGVPGPGAEATTDAEGKFSLEARTPVLTVSLHKKGYGRTLLQDVDIHVPLPITLEKAATIIGKLLAADGTPRKDASVRISSSRDQNDVYYASVNADGSYAATDLPSGAYRVDEGDRTTTVQVTAGQTVAVAWQRKTGVVLHGTVQLSAGPSTGCQVTVEAAPNAEFTTNTTTDQHGQYTLYLPLPGSYFIRVWVQRGAFDEEPRLISVHAGDNQYDISRIGSVSGQLRDATSGKPIAGMKVQAEMKSSLSKITGQASALDQHLEPYWLPAGTAETDAQGHFSLPNLPAGECLIALGAGKWGGGPVLLPPCTLRDSEHKSDIALQLPAFGSAEISVVDTESKQAIPRATVVCVDQWGHMITPDQQPKSTPDPAYATYTFAKLPAGDYRVRTSNLIGQHPLPENYLDANAGLTVTAGKTTSLQLPLARGGRLHLTQHGVGTQPADATVAFQYSISTPGGDAPVLSDAAGLYTGGLFYTSGITLDAPKKLEYTLTLPPGTYHLIIRRTRLAQLFSPELIPLLTGPATIDREVTIVRGQDVDVMLQ